MRLYSVGVALPKLITKRGIQKQAELAKSLEGIEGVHPMAPYATLWFFDTLNHAKIARNVVRDKGIKTAEGIGIFEHDGTETVFKGVAD